MNRFFSKLDLRDIKIDPQGTRFPHDADEPEPGTETAMDHDPAPAFAATGNGGTPISTEEPIVPATNGAAVLGDGRPTAWEEGQATATPGLDDPAAIHGVGNGHVASTLSNPGTGPERNGEVLKVSARSRPSAVAGAIAGVVRDSGRAEVQAIGAGATNQAVKAVAIARDYLRETGIEAVCLPAFIDITIENEDRTAILLVVEPR